MDKLPVTLYASLVEWINKFSKNAKVGRFAVKLCSQVPELKAMKHQKLSVRD